ncbi:MAG: hypothetical protein SGPRY_002899, partial [Prymnesium sp.]
RAAQRKGESPIKAGRKLLVSAEIEYKLEDLCLVLREMQLPIFRYVILNYVNVLLKGTAMAELLKHKEVRRHWYYNWLGRCERLKTSKIKPLEITRAKWATPENLKKHYDMLAELLIELKIAVPNPAFDESKPYSVRLKIIKPERIASMDETRLTNDTTEKNKSKSNRSVVKKDESREALANKGGGDGTGIGGRTADGKDLPGFFIFAENIIHSEAIKWQPICRRADAEGKPLPCRFWTNKEGCVTGDLGRVADLLDVAREPWEASVNFSCCLKAWEAIGVNPFNQKVYWDIIKKKQKSEEVATKADLDPELLTVQGMDGRGDVWG